MNADPSPAAFPLTQLQQAYLQGRDPHLPLGGVATAAHYDFNCRTSASELEQAIDVVVARHEMLRMVACVDTSTQHPIEPSPYRVAMTDLRALSVAEANAWLAQQRDERVREVMNPSRWPCFRFGIILLPEGGQLVTVDFDLFFLDGPSIMQVIREIADQLAGAPDDVGELVCEEPSFAQLLEQTVARHLDHDEVDRDYWSKQFAEYPSAPALPLARSMLGEPAGAFRRVCAALSTEEWQALSSAARDHRASALGAVMEAYVDSLRRWSGDPSFVLNLTTSTRPSSDKRGARTLGEFTSTMLLPVAEPREGFWADAVALGKQLRSAMPHRRYSGIDVAKDLVSRFGQRPPLLAPVVFTGMSMDARRFTDGLHALGETAWSCSSTPQVLVDCQMIQTSTDISISLDYREPCLESRSAQGLLDDMMAMLRACIRGEESPEESVSLSALDASLWESVNATDADVPDALLHDLADEQMRAHPDRPIVRDAQGWHTNQELRAQAESVYSRLAQFGVGIGDYIAIDGNRQAKVIAAMLGVLRTGASYVPLDPDQPQFRQTQILESSRACIRISGDEFIVLREPLGHQRRPMPDDPAYAIFTSGTTGTPKGVVVSHRSVVNTVLNVIAQHQIGAGDRIAGVSSFSFDLSVFDVYAALFAQAQLVLYSDRRDVPALADGLCSDAISVWNTVPAIMGLVVEELERRGTGPVQPYWCRSGRDRFEFPWDLRLVLLSGDWIPVDLPDRIRSLAPAASVVSLGGATEGAIWSIWFDIGGVEPQWKSIPYGHAMRNQSIWILDHRLRIAPVGSVGEIAIGGLGVAQGYLNAPELTERAFVRLPGLGRMYRTGDFGRLQPDGEIWFLGRRDSQVKLSGHRIELSEIESAMLREFPVSSAAAALKEVSAGEKPVLCLYYTSSEEFTLGEVRRRLGSQLPRYMVPTNLIRLDRLPMTSNGKVHVAMLPSPYLRSSGAAMVEATDPHEALVRELWSAVLGADALGLEDDVFDAGADSLAVIQMHSRLRDAGVTTISVLDIFENPTVRALAALVTTVDAVAPQPGPTRSGLWRPEEHQRCWDELELIESKPISKVLLTGATGYLGSYLLRNEVERGSEVWCLVRGHDRDHARQRLETSLTAKYGPSLVERFKDQVHCVLGDITQPMLGLTDGALAYCADVDYFIHAAADVSHFAAEGGLAKTNESAVGEVIRVTGSLGAGLCQISTSQVMGMVPEAEGIFGELSNDVGQAFVDQYSLSKYRAEQICFAAFESGLPGTVMRVGNLAFDSRTGALPDDPREVTFAAIMEVIATLGVLPDNLAQIADLSYVDIAAEAISALIHAKVLPKTRVFHVMNSHRPSLADIQRLVGGDLRPVPAAEFRARAEQRFAAYPNDRSLRNCLLNAHVWEGAYGIAFSAVATNGLLASLGVQWPRIDSIVTPITQDSYA